MKSSVAVVTVTYNSADLLPEFFQSIETGMGNDVDWVTVVADNASQDASVEVVRTIDPSATVVQMGSNAGYAAGINAAIAQAPDVDAYLVLNPDVRLRPGCVVLLLEALNRPGVGIAVPRLVDANEKLILSMRREPTVLRQFGDALLGAERAGRLSLLGEIVSDESAYSSSRFTDWAEGSTQLMSAECVALVGSWDEQFFLYSEEAEYDLRARDAGLATYFEAGASATHLEGGSSGSPLLWALVQTNRVRLFAMRNGRWATAFFWAATVLREGSRSILGKKTSRAAFRALISPGRLTATPGPHLLVPRSAAAQRRGSAQSLHD